MTDALKKYEETSEKLPKALKVVSRAIDMAKSLTVDSPESMVKAGEYLNGAKKQRRFMAELRDSVVGPLHELHKGAIAKFKPHLSGWDECIDKLNAKMDAYEAERLRVNREREAELRRIADEEARVEREEAERFAKESEARGDVEQAKEIREEADRPAIPVPMIPQAETKLEGIVPQKRWTFEVSDLDAVPMEYCTKEVLGDKVRAEAKRTNGKCQIPGIKVFQKTVRVVK